MATEAVDVDDFGLPIRRFPTPKIEASADEDAEQANTADSVEKDSVTTSDTKSADDKPPVTPDAQPAERDDGKIPQDAKSNEPPSPTEVATEPATAINDKSKESSQEKPVEEPEKKSEEKPETPKIEPSQTDSPVPETSTKPDPLKPETKTIEPTADTETPVEPQNALQTAPISDTENKVAHKRQTSDVPSIHRGGVSEYSHQRISSVQETKEDDGDSGWQEMPSYARYDMYDDDDRLIAREFNAEEEEKYGYGGLGGAGKGYTRVLLDDDAESATSMDDNTQYLFKQGNGTSAAVDDEEGRDAVSQMQATKDLLTEGQRIAYVGVVRLEIANMVKMEEDLEKTRSTKKLTAMSAEAMKMWGQKMMIRLYSHMDISEAEQIMIEQLAEHGVMPADLTPALITNARVHNPMADDRSSTRSSISSPRFDEKPAQAPPPYELHEGDLPEVKTPSQLPTTDKIDIDLRWTVLCDLFLILIADSIYDARSRFLLERVGKSIDITWIDICRFEKKVTDALEMQQAAEKENWNEDEHMENRRKQALKRRYVMMGLATVGGGLVIGLSAGLLAPVIGAGLATGLTAIGVTGTSSFLGGVGGAAIITSGAATTGSIIGGKAANRRTGAVKTFEYRPLHNNKRVNLIVTISGWLTGKVDDVRLPFSTVDSIMGDIYSVHWEPEMLQSIGDTMNILATEALTQSIQQVLGATILAGLMSALQLPLILTKLSYLIDNPWAVSLDRAWSAGKILADSLLERNLGTRPITLVGYSIGARVIFSCLLELAKKGAYGVVQNVYMFGSPIVVKKDEYITARTVISGRFVNAYNRNDWILGYLFRLTNGGIRRVAGLAAVETGPWVENMDVSDLVVGHMDYRSQMPSLLMRCGWNVQSEEFAEIEDPDPDNHAERQRELINEIEEARRKLEQEGNSSKGSRFSIFGRKKKLEKQEWEIYEDSASKSKVEEKKEKTDGPSSNQGVLFDVDAIRAEIARDAYDGDTHADELQVKEIKSTLPPMKLDISAFPPSPAPSNFGSRNGDSGPVWDSPNTRISREASPSFASPSYAKPAGQPPAYGDSLEDDEIQMTFDTSFNDSKPPAVPPKDTEPTVTLSRPEYKTSQTMPAMTLHDPWGDSDDEDFGKEKEISMTFA